jgi:hypothetical protein
MSTWSPTSLFNRRAYGSENLRPMPQKDFCNTIPLKADSERTSRQVRFVPKAEVAYPNLYPAKTAWRYIKGRSSCITSTTIPLNGLGTELASQSLCALMYEVAMVRR